MLLSQGEMDDWFQELHPQSLGVGNGAWTDAFFKGQVLLRKTAWYVWPPCQCAYDYADTHQDIVSNPLMYNVIHKISQRIFEVCGVQDNPPNSVNLNFYPPGGGVGFHSDDEPLFDGLRREAAIISLSLAEVPNRQPAESFEKSELAHKEAHPGMHVLDRTAIGSRWFEVRLKRAFGKDRDVQAVELRHGDLMTMEGLFQLYYLHSAWPGDRNDTIEEAGRSAYGERINLTWRWIVQHMDGCPLSASENAQSNGWRDRSERGKGRYGYSTGKGHGFKAGCGGSKDTGSAWKGYTYEGQKGNKGRRRNFNRNSDWDRYQREGWHGWSY